MLSGFAPLFRFQVPTSMLLHFYASGNCNQKDEQFVPRTNVEVGGVELRITARIELSKSSSSGSNRTMYGSRNRTEIILGQPRNQP